MNDELRRLLAAVAAGELLPNDALARLRHLPFEDLGVARVDHHRELRQGVPEVIFAEGKRPEDVAAIAVRLAAAGQNVLCTRASVAHAAAVREQLPAARYEETARLIIATHKPAADLGRAAVLTAGTADLPVAEEAALCAEAFGLTVRRFYDVGVAGLHRLLAVRADIDEADVLIVVAGMEGALPSVVGGLFAQPIIAVPTSVGYGTSLGGLTTLHAMLTSCASGVTVVNIDNGFGAAAAARRMLRPRPS